MDNEFSGFGGSKVESIKKWKIGSKIFLVSSTIKYLQYYKIINMFNETKIDISGLGTISRDTVEENLRVGMDIGKIVTKIMLTGKVPELFSFILVEEGKEWKEDYAKESIKDIEEITDVQMIEVLIDFFTGRGVLLGGLVNAFKDLMPGLNLSKKNSESIEQEKQ